MLMKSTIRLNLQSKTFVTRFRANGHRSRGKRDLQASRGGNKSKAWLVLFQPETATNRTLPRHKVSRGRIPAWVLREEIKPRISKAAVKICSPPSTDRPQSPHFQLLSWITSPTSPSCWAKHPESKEAGQTKRGVRIIAKFLASRWPKQRPDPRDFSRWIDKSNQTRRSTHDHPRRTNWIWKSKPVRLQRRH